MCSLSATIKNFIPDVIAMQEVNIIQEHRSGYGRRNFALCDSCFWSATILHGDVVSCPMCARNVSLIPLASNEEYKLKMSPASGVEISFSKAIT